LDLAARKLKKSFEKYYLT